MDWKKRKTNLIEVPTCIPGTTSLDVVTFTVVEYIYIFGFKATASSNNNSHFRKKIILVRMTWN